MKKQIRRTKSGHTAILLRNVPDELHDKMKRAARLKGITLKAFILEAARKEVGVEKS
jgi:uncharacterized protein (DUF1778 family)